MGISVHIRKELGSFGLSIDFDEDSKRIGILGASGSGKSMTLKAIAGIVHPEEGQIRLNERTLFDSAQKVDLKPQERRVGYLFQNYALFPTMTVEQNVAAGLRGSRGANAARTKEMIRKFQLEGLEKRLPTQLSGGQQQRVALARIMAYQPDVILLDEPFSALDGYLKDHMQEELIEMLEDYDGTVIMVSHSRDEIYRFSQRLFILDRGEITNHGDTKEIFDHPVTKTAAMLTGCKNFSDVKILDPHTLEAMSWGITLHVTRELSDEIHYIGYRAHQFEPIWGEREENCIAFRLSSKAELQFERNFYVKPETETFQRDDILTWLVQRACWQTIEEKGLPDYLKLHERDMLFLK